VTLLGINLVFAVSPKNSLIEFWAIVEIKKKAAVYRVMIGCVKNGP